MAGILRDAGDSAYGLLASFLARCSCRLSANLLAGLGRRVPAHWRGMVVMVPTFCTNAPVEHRDRTTKLS
jgi:hypothetical protein